MHVVRSKFVRIFKPEHRRVDARTEGEQGVGKATDSEADAVPLVQVANRASVHRPSEHAPSSDTRSPDDSDVGAVDRVIVQSTTRVGPAVARQSHFDTGIGVGQTVASGLKDAAEVLDDVPLVKALAGVIAQILKITEVANSLVQ